MGKIKLLSSKADPESLQYPGRRATEVNIQDFEGNNSLETFRFSRTWSGIILMLILALGFLVTYAIFRKVNELTTAPENLDKTLVKDTILIKENILTDVSLEKMPFESDLSEQSNFSHLDLSNHSTEAMDNNTLENIADDISVAADDEYSKSVEVLNGMSDTSEEHGDDHFYDAYDVAAFREFGIQENYIYEDSFLDLSGSKENQENIPEAPATGSTFLLFKEEDLDASFYDYFQYWEESKLDKIYQNVLDVEVSGDEYTNDEYAVADTSGVDYGKNEDAIFEEPADVYTNNEDKTTYDSVNEYTNNEDEIVSDYGEENINNEEEEIEDPTDEYTNHEDNIEYDSENEYTNNEDEIVSVSGEENAIDEDEEEEDPMDEFTNYEDKITYDSANEYTNNEDEFAEYINCEKKVVRVSAGKLTRKEDKVVEPTTDEYTNYEDKEVEEVTDEYYEEETVEVPAEEYTNNKGL